MKRLRAIATIFVALALAAPAVAQPAQHKPPSVLPSPPADTINNAISRHNASDVAYGAYERGFYLTAFNEATKFAQQNDPAAMTLLGELYANGLGVSRDDTKAAQWYKLAASHGDRDAMFALAMFSFEGRAGPRDEDEAARLLAAAGKLGHPAANYDLGLLYLQGQQFPQDFKHAAQLFRQAADAGNPEAQYALATMYKEGRGVPKDIREYASLLRQASIAGNLDAMVEYGIAQFNGEGTDRNEPAAARLLLAAARRGSPIAQDRMARILMAGRGMPADPTQAIRWHIIAKAAGASDPELDLYASRQPKDVRDAAEAAARKWLSTAVAVAPTPPPAKK
jgi:TPR repeat protein